MKRRWPLGYFNRKQQGSQEKQTLEIFVQSSSRMDSSSFEESKGNPERHGEVQISNTQPSSPSINYPWSTHNLLLTPASKDLSLEDQPHPLPRYGHSLSGVATSTGNLYLFGGLVHGSFRNDLHRISALDHSTSFVKTTGQIPAVRVGHASALIKDVLIVWGGDTHLADQTSSEAHDNSLYLLNLVTKEWSRLDKEIQGSQPIGRYGHTGVMLGTTFVVFGGQSNGDFLNDLWMFDLRSLKTRIAWNFIEPIGNVAPAERTGHICVPYKDEIFIFGGTDGYYHYNDTWSFNIHSRRWSELQCIGFIPAPREGHAAAIVGDMIYIFGGRDVKGKDLGDLCALRISNLRWYIFQNMGVAPFARSGHTMAAVEGRIYVVGGESFVPKLDEDTRTIHILDTQFIKYPTLIAPGKQLDDSELSTRLSVVLQDKELYRRLLDCSSSDAQRLLDSFQHLLDRPNLEASLRKNLIVATQRLAYKTGLYPACYELKGVSEISEYPIAAGGFADIYKGNFEGQSVCIKMIRLYQKDQIEHAIKKFSKEAILWGQLMHPNILTIYGIYKFRGLVSIVSEWMENGDIVAYLNNHPSVSRLQLAVDVCLGLLYLHENNIIHGDLKGSNILIDNAGRARLADFGISSVSDPKIIAWTSQSSSNSEGGTVRWQAPELFDVETDIAGARNTVASDMYSWGCVCYEIFTGEIPFAHISNNYTVVVAVKSGSHPMRPEPSSSSWQLWGLTEEIWESMEHCWSRLPSDRPSAAAIIERLSTNLPQDKRENIGIPTFSTGKFRSRMSKETKVVTVEYLNDLLGNFGGR